MIEKLRKLNQIEYSLWYDNIERILLHDGTLQGMVDRGEIRGITSNPSIFNKAISQSSTYDDDIQELTRQGLSREEVFEKLAVKDIQDAADLFLPLYQDTNGGDGFVSLEVSPLLAYDTAGTLQDAKRLWNLVDRPNLMVKIPATLEGLPAITDAIGSGININVTLIFGLERYQQVREAYLAGLEKRLADGKSIQDIHSVASFFLSRIDTKVDQMLEDLRGDADQKTLIDELMGKIAVASGKLAYVDYEKTFGKKGEGFKPLAKAGGNRQRALWASTSTKNPAYPDTKYVDELVGPRLVNTVPPQTLSAFLDHGSPEESISQNLDKYRKYMSDIADLGIDIKQVTKELETEGVEAFAISFNALLDTLEGRMQEFKN